MDFTFAANSADVATNIERYDGALEKSRELQRRASYHQSWYGVRKDDDTWIFGPSKFVGYEALDADEYVESAVERNGRATETHLQKWFTVVEDTDPLHVELMAALRSRLGELGLTPRATTRINILPSDRQPGNRRRQRVQPSRDDDLVNLLIRVASRLSPGDRTRLQSSL